MSDIWTLFDAQEGTAMERFEIFETIKTAKYGVVPLHVQQRRIVGGPGDGVDVIDIEAGELKLSVLPTRGMGIWKGHCGDVPLKWNSPTLGPVHPKFVNLADPSGLGWLDGFDEWFVRCGLESNGSPEFNENGTLKYSLHGKIQNTPAHTVKLELDRENGILTLTGIVRETRLFFKNLELTASISIDIGSTAFTVRDTVKNISSGEPGEFQLLYHINSGIPLAFPRGKAIIPFERLAPRTPVAVENLPTWNTFDAPAPGSEEVVFFIEPAADKNGDVKTAILSIDEDRGLALGFNTKTLPYFSFWKSRLNDGDGYVVGLEPATNFPNNKSFEKKQGRVVPLKPGESQTHELRFEVLRNADSVQRVKSEIEALQKTAAGKIEPKPVSEWTP